MGDCCAVVVGVDWVDDYGCGFCPIQDLRTMSMPCRSPITRSFRGFTRMFRGWQWVCGVFEVFEHLSLNSGFISCF